MTRNDDGIGLIEMTVGVALFAIVAVFMVGFMGSAMSGVLHGRQRATAIADANLLLESARSLAYGDVGLVSSDNTLGQDASIDTSSATSRSFGGEPIVWSQTSTGHPFNPHTQQVGRSPSLLTRNVYVTGVDTDGDSSADLKRVTVRVSWERQGLGGVANSVSAVTVIAPSSPGTPGNPPLSQSGAPAPFPPLFGAVQSRGPSALVEAEIGTGANLDDATAVGAAQLRVVGASGRGDNLLNATSSVTCAQQEAAVHGATSTAGTQWSSGADSVERPGPFSAGGSQYELTSSVTSGSLSVTTSALSGQASCSASGETDGAQLPSQAGWGTLNPLALKFDSTSASLSAGLGTFAPVETAEVRVDHSSSQATPADKRIDTSAVLETGDLTVLRQTSMPDAVDLQAPDGLVHIPAFKSTASASASTATGSSSVTADPAKPLRVRIWDNGSASNLTDGSGGSITCHSRSGNYCELEVSTTTGRMVQLDQTWCFGPSGTCAVDVHVVVTVSISPASSVTDALTDGYTRAYHAEWTPLNVQARISARDHGAASDALDVRVSTDVGSLTACSKYGFFAGGCPWSRP